MLKRFRKAITRTILAIVVMTLVLTSQYGMVEAEEINDDSGNISEISTNDIYGNVSTEEDEQRDIAIDSAFVDTTRDVLADEVEKDASGNIEGLTDRFGEDEFDLDTDRITDPAELENVKLIPYMLSTRKIETVGADGYNIINGADYVSYGEAEFLGLSDGIYKKEGNSETKVSDDIASNFNVLGNNIVFTTIKDGKYAIEGIDANTFEFAFEYLLDDYKIKQMYVINDEYFFILSDGDIYAIGMYDLSIDRLTTQGDIFSFIPTTEGVLYATGSLFDYDVYFGKTKILDSVSDWFTTEYGVVYRTRDAIEKQIKYADMKSVTLNIRGKAGYSSDVAMEATSQISKLSTDGDDEMEQISIIDFFAEVGKVDESYRLVEQLAESTKNENFVVNGTRAVVSDRQEAIVSKAEDVYSRKIVTLAPIKGWDGLIGAKEEFNGIIYGQPWAKDETERGFVLYNISLDEYISRINGDITFEVYDENKNIGNSPRWSTDCSTFVSYCWDLADRTNCTGLLSYSALTNGHIQIGDILLHDDRQNHDSHVKIITDIRYNSEGEISYIETTEQTVPCTYRLDYESFADFQRVLNNSAYPYTLYRLSDMEDEYHFQISESNLNLYVGQSKRLTEEHTPNGKITWSSSNPSVVKVDSSGLVTALKASNTPVTITCNMYAERANPPSKDLNCIVNVTNAPITLNCTAVTLYDCTGHNYKNLTASIPTGTAISWYSTDNNVATVNGSGRVTAVARDDCESRECYIVAKSGDSEAKCKIVVKEPTLSIPSSKEFYVTESVNLTATTTPASTITWTSSNSSIATVSGGKVTGKSAGKCTITATANGKSASCAVTVMAPSINMNRTDITKYIGESFTFTASVHPSATVTWTTTDSRVARVSGGVTTAVGVGTCNIKATANGVTATAKFTVLKPSISLNTSTLRLYKGEKYLIGATVAPSGRTVKWTTSNSSVATVASDGRVTAVAAGTATITASIDGAQASCAVTVNNKSLSISSSSVSLYKGQTTRITASTAPSATVSWSSSNTSVATVSGGTITAKGAGTCTITASANGLSANCTVKVTNPSLRISQTSLYIKKGSSATLTATTTPSTSISWSSSDTKVATVSGGKVTAKNKGRCVIYAKANGLTVTCSVTVQ